MRGFALRPARLKRPILQLHLFAGTLLCLLFVSWFASGIVMLFQSYPGLTEPERVAALPALDCRRCLVGARDALAAAGLDASTTSPRLGMLLNRPVWRAIDASGQWRAVFADHAAVVPSLTATAGAEVARAFLGQPHAVRFVETLHDADQWTLTRSVRNQMPLHRYDVSDPAQTRVYVAATSGEVVSASTRRERWLTWIGAIPHWIYPTMLRRHAEAWSWLVIVLSAAGTVLCLSGVAIGLWQWRWRRRARRIVAAARTPYRELIMRWHHYLGLGFGTIACTYVFSGLMSMNPLRWSPGTGLSASQQLAWMGGPLEPERMSTSAAVAWRTFQAKGLRPKELQIKRLHGQHYWVARMSADSVRYLPTPVSDTTTTAAPILSAFPLPQLMANAATLVPGARLLEASMLTTYDHYYRDRNAPLPVARLRFGDDAGTWLYLDPRTGTVAQQREWRSRIERWLYSGLHTLDVGVLPDHTTARKTLAILLSVGGLLLSLTGLVLGWRLSRATLTGVRRYRRR